MAYLEYSEFLSVRGKLDQALEMARKASAIDPVTPNPTHAQGYINMMMGNYTEAAALFKSAIDLHPDWIWGHVKLGNTYSRAGNHDAALAEAGTAESLLQGRGTPLTRAWIGRIHAAAGNESRARGILTELDKPEVDPAIRTFVYAALDEREAAMACLEDAVARHSGLSHHVIPIAKLEPQLRLWDEPRYRRLLEELGLSQDMP